MFPWNEITAQDESHRSCELPGWDDGHGNTEPDRDGGGHWRGAGCEWFLTSHRGLHSHLSPPHSHDLGPGDQATLLGWCLGIVFVTWIMVHIYIYTSLFTAHVNIDLPEINLRKGRLLLPFKDLNNNILLANLTSRTMKPISHLPEKPPWPFWMSIWSRNIFLSGFSNEETRKYKVTADTENCDEADFKTWFWWLVEKFSIKISNFLYIIQTDKEIKSYLIKF